MKRIDMSESLYSTSEVARLFEINRVTIYRWVQEGVVKAYKVGKHLKIPASEVERLWKEFGFPEASYIHASDTGKKSKARDSASAKTKYEQQKKLVIAVGSDDSNSRFTQRIFAETALKDECILVIYTDTLEAALAIGKEKPDLLLINIMKSDGSAVEFAKKIRGIHSDIKIIFVENPSVNRDKKRGADFPADVNETVGRERLHQEITNALGLHGKN
jgi:excisionase family DNA binding protein